MAVNGPMIRCRALGFNFRRSGSTMVGERSVALLSELSDRKFVFIAGLHRSGTSILFQCLREHPEISGFRDTGAIEDEGQLLQTVYPPASVYGGPGRFGFDSRAALDEHSELVTEQSARELFAQWSAYWDLSKSVLLEKSPPNLVRMRFLQALFPNAHFIIITRHPVAVAYATMRKNGLTVLHRHLQHWLVCHERARRDCAALERVLVIGYEAFVENPAYHLDSIYSLLQLTPHPNALEITPSTNQKYFDRWERQRNHPLTALPVWAIERTYRASFRRFGYSLRDTSYHGPSVLCRNHSTAAITTAP